MLMGFQCRCNKYVAPPGETMRQDDTAGGLELGCLHHIQDSMQAVSSVLFHLISYKTNHDD